MSTSNNVKKSFPRGVERLTDAAILGLQTSLPAGVTELTVGGVTYQVVDLIALLQDEVKPWKSVRGAHSLIREVMRTRPEDQKRLSGLLRELKVGLSAKLGSTSEDLRNFGFAPKKEAKPMTSEQAALRAAKAKLTRELRHTMGSRQRAELKAETPSITISPNGESKVDPTPPSTP